MDVRNKRLKGTLLLVADGFWNALEVGLGQVFMTKDYNNCQTAQPQLLKLQSLLCKTV